MHHAAGVKNEHGAAVERRRPGEAPQRPGISGGFLQIALGEPHADLAHHLLVGRLVAGAGRRTTVLLQ